jgi:steroid 5-alpha reductase family enzyme
MDPFISISLFNLAAVTALMTAGWMVSVCRHNVTIVDSLWGLGFVLVAGITYGMGSGFTGRRLLVLILATAWGLRLAIHLTWRNWGEGEDHRYGTWREKSGHRFRVVSLFKVFGLQAIFLWTISLVLQQAQLSPDPARFTGLDILGTGLWAAGLIFESVADWQLARFKADPDNHGRVMDQGLWAWSRHPNYFGEFSVWWGFFLIALSTPGGWWTVVSPLIVSAVLLKMTGVPLTEAALQKRRPGYAEYMQRTSPFFPRPPGQGPADRRAH